MLSGTAFLNFGSAAGSAIGVDSGISSCSAPPSNTKVETVGSVSGSASTTSTSGIGSTAPGLVHLLAKFLQLRNAGSERGAFFDGSPRLLQHLLRNIEADLFQQIADHVPGRPRPFVGSSGKRRAVRRLHRRHILPMLGVIVSADRRGNSLLGVLGRFGRSLAVRPGLAGRSSGDGL